MCSNNTPYMNTKPNRKQILKWISKNYQVLPEQTYKAYHKYFTPRVEEVLEEPLNVEGVTEETAEPKTKKVMRFGVIEDHPWNHRRRLKTMYDTYGWEGITSYFGVFGFQISNQQNN